MISRVVALLALALASGVAQAEPQRGIAVGAEVGQPVAVTAAWFGAKLAVAGGIGTGTFSGSGPAFHAEVLAIPVHLAPRVPLLVGLGGRVYHHDAAMSVDERADTHGGIRAVVALAYELGALQLYAEVAPGLDVYRSRSCTLQSGAASVCPHAMETPVFLDFAFGGRWFFGR